MAHKLDNMKAQRLAANHTIESLARKALCSDRTIITLENGGTIDVHVTQRIADALGVSLTTLGKREA